jgi:signal transduction histidine kinase
VKYRSPDRPLKVQIACGATEEHLLFSVTDNGLGMNQADESKIFAMFKRLHSHVDGSGIGLYIVKKIIDNADGKIEVESKEGTGSTFRVYLKR